MPLPFLAGQYADLTFAGLPARSYSMANKPGDALLEFHVRRAGQVSQHIHAAVKPGDRVTVNAPVGTSYLRDEHIGPVLAIAGGSGLGPIKSIIDTLLSRQSPPPIYFYFGVRAELDLYYADYFRDLAARGLLSSFRYFQNQPGRRRCEPAFWPMRLGPILLPSAVSKLTWPVRRSWLRPASRQLPRAG